MGFNEARQGEGTKGTTDLVPCFIWQPLLVGSSTGRSTINMLCKNNNNVRGKMLRICMNHRCAVCLGSGTKTVREAWSLNALFLF